MICGCISSGARSISPLFCMLHIWALVWYGVVWCGVVWCGVVWCGVVWCGVVWCGVVWYGWALGICMLAFGPLGAANSRVLLACPVQADKAFRTIPWARAEGLSGLTIMHLGAHIINKQPLPSFKSVRKSSEGSMPDAEISHISQSTEGEGEDSIVMDCVLPAESRFGLLPPVVGRNQIVPMNFSNAVEQTSRAYTSTSNDLPACPGGALPSELSIPDAIWDDEETEEEQDSVPLIRDICETQEALEKTSELLMVLPLPIWRRAL